MAYNIERYRGRRDGKGWRYGWEVIGDREPYPTQDEAFAALFGMRKSGTWRVISAGEPQGERLYPANG